MSSKSRKRKAADRRYRAWLKAVTSRPYLYIPDNTYVAPELLQIIRRHFAESSEGAQAIASIPVQK